MREGEGPELPEHLKESLSSVEAYEQQVRREFQITDYARKLQIPQESMETNPTVYRYVSVLRDADAASERLGRYEAIRPVLEEGSLAAERTGQASLLYAAEKMILEEGFPMWDQARRIDLDPERGGYSLTGLLDRAGAPYGLEVDVSEGWEEQQDYNVLVLGKPFRPQPEPAAGLWTGAPFTTAGEEPWQREGDRFHEWYWPDWPNERHDPEHLRALAEEATRHGIHPRPRVDPVMHTLLTGLLYGRRLVEETQDVDGLPPALGLMPPAHERLARVAPLNGLAVAVLEDAVRPGSLTPARFATVLEPVVKLYALIIKK
jgi:hypothetical protein